MRSLFVVRVGNLPYFLFILFLFAIAAFSVLLCRKKGAKFAKRYVSIILWTNFALHFLKQFLPHFIVRFPTGLVDSAFPNLCAVLIMLAPFVFHFGNAYFRDYFYYIGILSGMLVYFFPTGAMREMATEADHYFEMFRFYLCHWPLVVCPLVMVDQGMHRLDWKRLWSIPVIFCSILVLIALDQILFGPILKVPDYPSEWVGEHGVLNRACIGQEYTNQSVQFGPPIGADKAIGWLYPAFIPGLMVYWVDGVRYFTPAIWIFPFIALGAAIIGPLMALPYEHHAMKLDVLALRQRIKMRRYHRRVGK